MIKAKWFILNILVKELDDKNLSMLVNNPEYLDEFNEDFEDCCV